MRIKNHIKLLVFTPILVLLLQNPSTANAQMEKGDIMVEAYHGWPNLITSLARIAVNTGAIDNISATGLGPFGGRILYQYEETISVGVEFNYATSKLTWTERFDDGMGGTVDYDYNLEIPRMRFMIRADLTLSNKGTFLPYATGSLGFNYTQFKFTTDDPNAIVDQYDLPNLIPVGYHVGFGVRGFLTTFLALHAELKLGGPLLSGGITIRI